MAWCFRCRVNWGKSGSSRVKFRLIICSEWGCSLRCTHNSNISTTRSHYSVHLPSRRYQSVSPSCWSHHSIDSSTWGYHSSLRALRNVLRNNSIWITIISFCVRMNHRNGRIWNSSDWSLDSIYYPLGSFDSIFNHHSRWSLGSMNIDISPAGTLSGSLMSHLRNVNHFLSWCELNPLLYRITIFGWSQIVVYHEVVLSSH